MDCPFNSLQVICLNSIFSIKEQKRPSDVNRSREPEIQILESDEYLPKDYYPWKKEIISMIEQSKLRAILSVNAELLNLYWKIGKDILEKQKELGWGSKVIAELDRPRILFIINYFRLQSAPCPVYAGKRQSPACVSRSAS